MKINQLKIHQAFLFESIKSFLEDLCEAEKNTKTLIFLDESTLDFSQMKKFLNFDKNQSSNFDSRFLLQIMNYVFIFFKFDFKISDLIKFLFENQNSLNKKYKFFLNFGFGSSFFDENLSILDFLEIPFIESEFKGTNKKILEIINENQKFFSFYHKNHDFKNNFSFFFLYHIYISEKFILEFFNIEIQEKILSSLIVFKNQILECFIELPLMNFELYLIIFENEITKKKYQKFYTKGFEIIDFNFKNKKFDFFFINSEEWDLNEFSGENLLIISKNFKKENLKQMLIKFKEISFFEFSSEINDFKFDFENHFEKTIKKNNTKINYEKQKKKKLNSFDFFDLFFQKEKFFISNVMEKPELVSFFERKIEFLPSRIFEKICSEICNFFLKKDGKEKVMRLEEIESMALQISEKEMNFKSTKRISKMISQILQPILKTFAEIFFYEINQSKDNFFFEKIECEIGDGFIANVKDFCFIKQDENKKIEIINFFYDKSFNSKNFLDLKIKIEASLQCFLLGKKYENYEIEMKFYIFKPGPYIFDEIKFDHFKTQKLINDFDEKIKISLDEISKMSSQS